MRSFGRIATLIVAVAAVLGVSAGELQRERRQLLDELGATQSGLAETAARKLDAYLDALDHDARILSNLVSRTRQPGHADVATENRILLSAFDALVAVVPHYRTIALYSNDGTAAVRAIDPTEDHETIAPALFASGRGIAAAVARARRPVLEGPIALGPTKGRFFYLLAAPAGADEVLVVGSDAGMLLHAALPASAERARYFVLDPQRFVWKDCERSPSCRPTPPEEMGDILRRVMAPETRWLGPQEASRVGLPPWPAILASARAASIGGPWTLVIGSSTAAISDRQSALLRQLIITTLAAALAVAAVGVFILRQQREAVALKERLHAAQQLATLREKSDAIIENAPIGILGTTEDGKIAIANRFLGERMGPIEIGRSWNEAFGSSFADGAGRLRALLERSRENPLGRVEERNVALLTPGADDFDVQIVSLRHPADEVRLLALIEDRTQLRSLERQLIRTEKILTAGVLSAGLAHEIGTPISVIRGRAEHLMEGLGNTAAAEDLAVIVRHADRISSTISQVLDFSRAQPIHVGPVEVGAVLEKTRQLLDWKLTAKRVSLAIWLSPEARPLSADPDQLEQVLVNLIMNACDACEEGGSIKVDVSPTTRGDQARLDIRDDGCGIPLEYLNAVFDPFFTTKKRGAGTGLGLTVAASIVRNHGGSMTVISAPGQGTTFSVLWPAVHAQAPA